MTKSFALFLLVFLNLGVFAQDDCNKLDAVGKKHGLWKGVFEESKRPRYEGTFDHGIEVGTFTYFDDTKAKSVIATRVFSEKGTVAYNTFFDQKGNKVSEGKTVNRLNEGEWNYYHEASKEIMTIENYAKGKLNGVRKVFFKSKAIAEEANYTNGLKNGLYKKYTEKGTVIETSFFKNGEYDGIAIFNDVNGKIVSKGPFVNGVKKGMWEFYEDGKLKTKQKYPIVKKMAKGKNKKI